MMMIVGVLCPFSNFAAVSGHIHVIVLLGRGLQNGRWQVVLLNTKLGAFEVLGSPKSVLPLKVRRESHQNHHPHPPFTYREV